jgi:hypothetical protein
VPQSALLRWGVGFAIAASIGCGSAPSVAPASPTPSDPNAPQVGQHTGSIAIEYVSASYAPGATIDGCGARLAGCAGRLRMTFRLRSTAAGSVLGSAARLHGTNKIACMAAVGPPFSLAANTSTLLDLVFDQVDPSCVLPFEATDLDVTVEGTIVGRQEFGIRYRFSS